MRNTTMLTVAVLLFATACTESPTEPVVGKVDTAVSTQPPQYAVSPITVSIDSTGNYYTADDGSNQSFEIARPSTLKKNAIAVIFIPGGGWNTCGKNSDFMKNMKAKLPIKLQGEAIILVPCYRVNAGALAIERDVRCFVKYVRWNALAINGDTSIVIDRNRIVVAGHSAGGHEAARIGRDNEPAQTCYQGVSSGAWRVITASAPTVLDDAHLTATYFNQTTIDMIPPTWGDNATRLANSPALTGGVCNITLIIQGTLDTNVRPPNGDLLKAACPAAELYKPAGSHQLQQTDIKGQVLDKIAQVILS